MDIAILGGGIVGCTLANLLSVNKNLRITLFEPKPPLLTWDAKQYDVRCSAIANAAQNIFVDLGVWQEIIDARVGIYNEMLIWDRDPQHNLRLSADMAHIKHLGYIVENRVIAAALYKKLASKDNVNVCNIIVNRLQHTDDHITLHMPGEKLDCKLVIGADGGNSWVRQEAGIDTYGWTHTQYAIVATVRTELPHNNTAMQRFTTDGQIAFLPLADAYLCSIVWSTSIINAEYLMQLNTQEFCNRLASEFSFALGIVELYGMRNSFPLQMLHAINYVLPRIALVGDAAHVVHPLAGQGLNLGILDAKILSEVLQQAYILKHDIGGMAILRKYERARKGHNFSMITLTEAIKFIFSCKHNTIEKMRLQSMRLIDSNSMIKNLMIKFATGC